MILKPHLPKNFLPRGEVGRAIEHIRKKTDAPHHKKPSVVGMNVVLFWCTTFLL
jgi:hypothetical protein